MGEVGLGDAGAGVPHGQADRIGLRTVRDLERDGAAVRELDTVAEQVEQHLAQLLAIAGHRRRHARGDRQVEAEVLLPGAALHEHHDILDQLVEVEDGVLHLDLARFDPRVVEDVVENAEQNLARRAHDPDLLPLALVQRAVGHETQHAEERRSSGCGSRDSWWRGTRTWRGSPARPGRGHYRGSAPPRRAGHWLPSAVPCVPRPASPAPPCAGEVRRWSAHAPLLAPACRWPGRGTRGPYRPCRRARPALPSARPRPGARPQGSA